MIKIKIKMIKSTHYIVKMINDNESYIIIIKNK